MKHFTYPLICFLLFGHIASSQELIETNLSHEGMSTGITAYLSADDGYLFSGFSQSSNFDTTSALLFHTDESLQVNWTQSYRIHARDDFSVLKRASNGDLLIGGNTRQNFTQEAGATFYRMDQAGYVIHARTYTDISDYRMNNIFEEADGELVQFIRYGVNNQPSVVLVTEPNGDIITQRAYSPDNHGMMIDQVISDGEGTYYVSGDALDSDVGYRIPYVAAMDTSDVLWYKRYDLGLASTATHVLRAENGELYITGTIVDSVSSLLNHSFIMHCDGAGEPITTYQFYNPGESTSFFSIQQKDENTLLVLGRHNNFEGLQALYMELSMDIRTVSSVKVYDHHPVQAFVNMYPLDDGRQLLIGGSTGGALLVISDAQGNAACSTSDGNMSLSPLAVTVIEKSPTSENPGIVAVEPDAEVTSTSIDRTDICSGNVGIAEESSSPFSIYPNPFETQVLIQSSDHLDAQVVIYDMRGQAVHRFRLSGDISSTIDLGELDAGLYIIEMSTEDVTYSHRLVKQ